MTGGSLSLTASRGVGQDVININPQITFFKKMYKRHTNFGIEAIQQTLTSTVNFGKNTEISILKSGSLITDMHFEFTLPPAAGDDGVDNDGNSMNSQRVEENIGCVDNFKGYARWVNAVGFAIVNEIKLKFGSNVIDKHTGLWYDVWNELTDPNRKEWPLVGKFNDRDLIGTSQFEKTRYYVPLKFYFNRNAGLAIPIFLLNENELKIEISLKGLSTLLTFGKNLDVGATAPVINSRSLTGFKFYANYVFLEQDEESRIQNSLPSEYLVETLDIKDNTTSGGVTNLVFENPTKELIWVFRHPDRIATGSITNVPFENNPGEDSINPNDIFNYSRSGKNLDLGYGSRDPFSKLTIQINNNDRFEQTDATFFRTMQPYKYHSNIPGGIDKNSKKQFVYVYSFALNPEEYQPTGSFNFSIGDELTSFNFTGPTTVGSVKGMSEYNLTIFSMRYEYIVFNFGRVTVSRVPIQSSFQEAQAEVPAQPAQQEKPEQSSKKESKKEATSKKSPAIQISSSKNAAVKQEINRRYATEVPYLYDQSLGKKKWSGLQGDFFERQKQKDLGKDVKNKQKDIF
jgi:hypothetical protein